MTFRKILQYKISLISSGGSRVVLYIQRERQEDLLSEKHALFRVPEVSKNNNKTECLKGRIKKLRKSVHIKHASDNIRHRIGMLPFFGVFIKQGFAQLCYTSSFKRIIQIFSITAVHWFLERVNAF
jgi:hypothetical protein